MKKTILFFGLLTGITLHAKDHFRIIQADAQSVTLEYSFENLVQKNEDINGKNYLLLSSPGCVPVLNEGFPQVLRNAVSIAVPEKAKCQLEITHSEFSEISNAEVAPSKGSLKRNINPSDVPYTFGNIYRQNVWYPASPSEITADYTFRGQHGISLSFYPVQVNPINKKIKVYSKVIVKISFKNSKGKALNFEHPVYNSAEEKAFMEQRFLNLNYSFYAGKAQYAPINEFGDMLIICHPPFMNQFQPFINWKKQRGIHTEIVSAAVTGTTDAAIQSYIQTYYNTHPNLLYVLLVGDHQQIRAYNAGPAGSETKWSDTYYCFVSGTDHYPDIMIGRFSSGDSTDIATMIERTLEYEKNPVPGDFYTKALGIGSDEGQGIGDEGEADWQHLRNIGNKLTATVTPTGYYSYFHEFYDGSKGGNDANGNPTSSMVSSAVNGGVSLFMYTGHGSQNSCATSNFSSSNINSCINNGKYPFSVQVACNNGTFINGTCFCEAFLRARNSNGPTGAIASAGSSILMAWAEPMDTQDEIGDILSNQYTNNKKYTIGGLFYNGQMHMLDMYPTPTGKEVMETWVMFGDPSVTMRTQNPSTITASHFHCVKDVATSFSIVTNAGPNAYATLIQNNQVIGQGVLTGTATTIAFTNTFSISQPITLTINEFNKIPYITTLPVCITAGVNEQIGKTSFSVVNPVKDNTLKLLKSKEYTGDVMLSLSGIDGKLLFSGKVEASNEETIYVQLPQISPGIYLLNIKDNGTQQTIKVIVE